MTDALVVTSSFLPGRGGIESYLSALCDAVAPRLAVMARARRDGVRLPDDLGYPTIGGPGPMVWPSRALVDAVETACGRLGTDRVIFGTPWPLVLIGPRLAARGLRYSVIVHGAEIVMPAAVPGLDRALAAALGGAELLLPVSRYTGEKLESFLSEKANRVPPIRVLRALVDTERFSPDADVEAARRWLGVSPEAKVVLYFGRLVERKGVHNAIRAMPAIRDRVPDARLVVAGTGPQLGRLRRLAESLHVPAIFTGRVPQELAAGVYAAADVFTLPVTDRWFGYEIEGLGVVLLEAAAAGTACVTGRSGGTPEAVVDGVTGFVVDA
ncbi:MAG TPA: glycosyltransferase family 4 protein, partial [Actinomycetota bacterium]|nr:glycosyltransferase family 4 protein [Actinomycetota bacterium]